ncbi:MAG: TIGR03960 family B12-binding radical SAM protein [bacterium]
MKHPFQLYNPTQITKPIRYLGEEINAVHKDKNSIKTHIALIFPEIYEIGMSALGIPILYNILNSRPDIWAERVFAPWTDVIDQLNKNKQPLVSLESKTPLNQFDILGFSISYELTYTNILTILHLANIPLVADNRNLDLPLVIAGGPCCFNPEPLANFFDLFVIGDGEEVIVELVETYQRLKQEGVAKKVALEEFAKLKGVYVPSLIDVSYLPDGRIKMITPSSPSMKIPISKNIVPILDNVDYPLSPIIPYTKIVHDRLAIEVARGCTRGCRFCQAGIIYRPVRERSLDKVLVLVESGLKNTGFEEVGLCSLSVGDYTNLSEIATSFMDQYAGNNISLSLPSLRFDSLKDEVISQIKRVRKTGVTLAIEAGSQRLRDVINKGVHEEQLMDTIESLYNKGWFTLKLYFMIGLPTERDDDLESIVSLIKKIKEKAHLKKVKRFNLNISVASFIPKPHTPFQWCGQDEIEVLTSKINLLKSRIKLRGVDLNWHDVSTSVLEAVLARGDRRLGNVIQRAWEYGCRFDSWREHFDFMKWKKAFTDFGLDYRFYSSRERDLDEVLPWEHISSIVNKDFLIKEYQKSLEGTITPDCRFEKCNDCGISFNKQQCFQKKEFPPLVFNNEIDIPKPGIKGDENPSSPLIFKNQRQKNKKQEPITDNEERTKIRGRYKKEGVMSFLSHLDLARTFARAFSRANIDVEFTKGFNPLPKMSFAMALPVGMETETGYIDVTLLINIPSEQIIKRINEQLPKGIQLLEVKYIPLQSKSITAYLKDSIYRINLDVSKSDFGNFSLSRHTTFINERLADGRNNSLIPFINSITPTNLNRNLELILSLRFNKGKILRPNEVIQAVYQSERTVEILSVRQIGLVTEIR